MLRAIIFEILSELNTSQDNIEDKVDKLFAEVKDTAKGIFFSGKIIALKDFIFDIPNEKSNEINSKLTSNLSVLVINSEEFILLLKQKIKTKIEAANLEKNLDSLLDILDYGHLKDMLKMFTV